MYSKVNEKLIILYNIENWLYYTRKKNSLERLKRLKLVKSSRYSWSMLENANADIVIKFWEKPTVFYWEMS